MHKKGTAVHREKINPEFPKRYLLPLFTETANYRSGLFKITNAAITPGTQPQSHNKKTINIEPQPLPITANGGHIIARRTLQKLIILILMDVLIRRYLYKVVTL